MLSAVCGQYRTTTETAARGTGVMGDTVEEYEALDDDEDDDEAINKQGLCRCRFRTLLATLLPDLGKPKACTFTTADDRIIIFAIAMKYNRKASGSLRAMIGVGALSSAMVVKL